MAKTFMGVRLQRLREERGISQVALARALSISPSYLNQIEHNQRPLTVPILLRINAQFGVDVQVFSDDEEAQLIAEVREVLADAGMESASLAEARSLASNMPGIARAVIELHRRSRVSAERADTLAARLGDGHKLASFALPGAHDEVRDYLNRRHNHVAELDEMAEAIFRESGLAVGGVAPRLSQRLHERHGVRVLLAQDDETASKARRFDAATRVLLLADHLRPGQQAFQMAVQLAYLELNQLLDGLIREGGFSSAESMRLARIGLANYFAGALVMPYAPFLQSAEELSYDLDRLSNRFGVGFEAVCHRLSTLQRPGSPGLPFFFVRVDRAGNVSKRHSAADFHFSRVGGSCPLWIVYEAFSQPERVLTQIAGMPDGRNYFWIARQVVSGPVGYGRQQKTFAVGLGCDLRHAHRLIYSRGLDLSDPGAATPIGVGCKVCERGDCPQRASPSLLER
ncbi:short-chain fatty acyl-CoA regulator family protein [Hydrocarboniphaga sp.]|uniref:short-chain fatty acyl-CoA regulator family protein n=1 Tax=Hydrocarboniphaga sp. TaxID=2033016 RepID=UPI00262202F5|nr:short-chain fatty acyl-CoA regulator family protein [Hydrocarboniphaga sp.]